MAKERLRALIHDYPELIEDFQEYAESLRRARLHKLLQTPLGTVEAAVAASMKTFHGELESMVKRIWAEESAKAIELDTPSDGHNTGAVEYCEPRMAHFVDDLK